MKTNIFKIDQTVAKKRSFDEIKELIEILKEYRVILIEENACEIVAFDDEKDLDGDYSNYITVDFSDLNTVTGQDYMNNAVDYMDEIYELDSEKIAQLRNILIEKFGCFIDTERAQIEFDSDAINEVVSKFFANHQSKEV